MMNLAFKITINSAKKLNDGGRVTVQKLWGTLGKLWVEAFKNPPVTSLDDWFKSHSDAKQCEIADQYWK